MAIGPQRRQGQAAVLVRQDLRLPAALAAREQREEQPEAAEDHLRRARPRGLVLSFIQHILVEDHIRYITYMKYKLICEIVT